MDGVGLSMAQTGLGLLGGFSTGYPTTLFLLPEVRFDNASAIDLLQKNKQVAATSSLYYVGGCLGCLISHFLPLGRRTSVIFASSVAISGWLFLSCNWLYTGRLGTGLGVGIGGSALLPLSSTPSSAPFFAGLTLAYAVPFLLPRESVENVTWVCCFGGIVGWLVVGVNEVFTTNRKPIGPTHTTPPVRPYDWVVALRQMAGLAAAVNYPWEFCHWKSASSELSDIWWSVGGAGWVGAWIAGSGASSPNPASTASSVVILVYACFTPALPLYIALSAVSEISFKRRMREDLNQASDWRLELAAWLSSALGSGLHPQLSALLGFGKLLTLYGLLSVTVSLATILRPPLPPQREITKEEGEISQLREDVDSENHQPSTHLLSINGDVAANQRSTRE